MALYMIMNSVFRSPALESAPVSEKRVGLNGSRELPAPEIHRAFEQIGQPPFMLGTDKHFLTAHRPVTTHDSALAHVHSLNVAEAYPLWFAIRFDMSRRVSDLGNPIDRLIPLAKGPLCVGTILFGRVGECVGIVLGQRGQDETGEAASAFVRGVSHKFRDRRLHYLAKEAECVGL